MSLDIKIIDGKGSGKYITSHEFKDKHNGLVVATRPYNYYEFQRYPFISEEFGENLNIPLVFGTPEKLHNGTDDILWTASTVAGTSPIFDSTNQMYNGTRSIEWNNPDVRSIFQLSPVSSSFDLSNSYALTMWIYVQADWQIDDSFSIYVFNNEQIGNKVFL